MPISAPPPSWASIKSKPTTVAGFGITDMASQSVASATNATNVANVTAAQVGSATAGVSVGSVGSYSLMNQISGAYIGAGNTTAGSNLRYTNAGASSPGAAPAGTWRVMGATQSTDYNNTLAVSVFLRIA